MRKFTIIWMIFVIPFIVWSLMCGMIATDYYLGTDHTHSILHSLLIETPGMMLATAITSGLSAIGGTITLMYFASVYSYRPILKQMDSYDTITQQMYDSQKELNRLKDMYTKKLEELEVSNDK